MGELQLFLPYRISHNRLPQGLAREHSLKLRLIRVFRFDKAFRFTKSDEIFRNNCAYFYFNHKSTSDSQAGIGPYTILLSCVSIPRHFSEYKYLPKIFFQHFLFANPLFLSEILFFTKLATNLWIFIYLEVLGTLHSIFFNYHPGTVLMLLLCTAPYTCSIDKEDVSKQESRPIFNFLN